MSQFGFSSYKENDLKNKLQRAGIFEKDIVETFVRSSGPGGQNVNKVSTCVHLKHIPTTIAVKYQKERSLGLNRYRARLLLLEKIEQRQNEIKQNEIQRIEKLRRKNRKRSKKMKEKILEYKHYHSQKKENRRRIQVDKLKDY